MDLVKIRDLKSGEERGEWRVWVDDRTHEIIAGPEGLTAAQIGAIMTDELMNDNRHHFAYHPPRLAAILDRIAGPVLAAQIMREVVNEGVLLP